MKYYEILGALGVLGVFSSIYFLVILRCRESSPEVLSKAEKLYSEGKIGKAYEKAQSLSEPVLPFSLPKGVQTKAQELITRIEAEIREPIEQEIGTALGKLKIEYEVDIGRGGYRLTLRMGEHNTSACKFFPIKDISPTYRKLFFP